MFQASLPLTDDTMYRYKAIRTDLKVEAAYRCESLQTASLRKRKVALEGLRFAAAGGAAWHRTSVRFPAGVGPA